MCGWIWRRGDSDGIKRNGGGKKGLIVFSSVSYLADFPGFVPERKKKKKD